MIILLNLIASCILASLLSDGIKCTFKDLFLISFVIMTLQDFYRHFGISFKSWKNEVKK